MKRRTLLERSSALGTVALAGCLSGATPGGESDDPRNGNETDGDDDQPEHDEISVADASVETVSTDCASDEDLTADVEFDESESAVAFSGVLTAGTPCHDVVLDSAEYDAESDRLAVVLATERDGEECVTCVGALDYEGTVTFEGGLPSEAYVAHDDMILGAAGGDSASDDSRPAGLRDSVIEVTDVSPGDGPDDADVEFDGDAVVVDGTITGSDGCRTAELGDVEYDADADELSIDVATTADEDADETMCSQSLVEIEYVVRAEVAGGAETVTVSHDGRALVSAGHGSASAEAPAE